MCHEAITVRAQTQCTTKRPINPHLTRICSQFARENRPGAADTALAHAEAPRPPRGASATTSSPPTLPSPFHRSVSAEAGDPCTFYATCLLPLHMALLRLALRSAGHHHAALHTVPTFPLGRQWPAGQGQGPGRVSVGYPARLGVSTAFLGFCVFSWAGFRSSQGFWGGEVCVAGELAGARPSVLTHINHTLLLKNSTTRI